VAWRNRIWLIINNVSRKPYNGGGGGSNGVVARRRRAVAVIINMLTGIYGWRLGWW
jgi:hypothetical protein